MIIRVLPVRTSAKSECGLLATEQVAKDPHVAKMHASLPMVGHCAQSGSVASPLPEDGMCRLTAQIGLLALTLALCAVGLSGCANLRLPTIDPSGECLFIDPAANPQAAFRDTPPTNRESTRVGIVLCPRATVAPIGSEVILLAGVRGPDQYLRTNERVEWMIDPGSVGQFVDLDKGSWTDPFVGDFTRARKVDNCYAVNTTSRRLLRLTRGTPDTSDDVEVLKGQSWVTLTSACEGTTDVTVYCPGVSPWQSRTETCQVHWVDAQWSFPSIAMAESGGRQLLTTTVTRQSNCAPRTGWIVRYEITGGPPAAFAPDGAQVVEIPTDPQGKASVELYQTESQAGTSKISIQVIRPAGLGCPDQRIIVGRTCLAQTWSAPSLGVRVLGPAAGSVGSNNGFRIEVSNPGDMAAEGVMLTTPVPPGLSYVSASPASEGTGNTLRWTIGRLAPGEVRSIALDLRADRAGGYEVCGEAVAASGLSARGCANVAIETADLAVDVAGPTEATVGDFVTHRIVVSNRSRVPATSLVLTDVRDAGLEHDISKRQIERALGNLGPMQSQEVTITFRASEAGRKCHTVQVTGAGGLRASTEACIDVRAAAPVQPATPPSEPSSTEPSWNEPGPSTTPPTTPSGTPPATPPVTQPPSLPRFEVNAYYAVGGEPPIKIRDTQVGKRVLLILDVASSDQKYLSGLTIAIQMPESFKPVGASDGYKRNGTVLYWENQSVPEDSLGRYAIDCLCQEVTANACFYATVTDTSGQEQRCDACIPVTQAEEANPAQPTTPAAPTTPNTQPTGHLGVTINTTVKPVAVGSTFSYLVQVTNHGTVEDRDVTIRVAFPPGLTPQQWRTRGPAGTPFVIRDNKVTFDAVPSLPAGEQLEYTIIVKADEAADEYVVQADAKSANQPVPVSSQDTIRVSAF